MVAKGACWTNLLPWLQSQNPHIDGRKEPTSQNCPLTSTWAQTHQTHTYINSKIKFLKERKTNLIPPLIISVSDKDGILTQVSIFSVIFGNYAWACDTEELDIFNLQRGRTGNIIILNTHRAGIYERAWIYSLVSLRRPGPLWVQYKEGFLHLSRRP